MTVDGLFIVVITAEETIGFVVTTVETK